MKVQESKFDICNFQTFIIDINFTIFILFFFFNLKILKIHVCMLTVNNFCRKFQCPCNYCSYTISRKMANFTLETFTRSLSLYLDCLILECTCQENFEVTLKNFDVLIFQCQYILLIPEFLLKAFLFLYYQPLRM